MKFRFLFIAVFLMIALGGCKKDPCRGVDCLNGVCNEGICVCDSGWKGDLCTVVDDPCQNVLCLNGVCVNGECECDPGFEGADCGTSINVKFNGIYSLDEDCVPSGSAIPYSISIIGTAINPTSLTVIGLWENPTASASAEVGSDGLTFTIPRQNYDGTFEIEGSGSIDAGGNTIQISYTVYDDSSNVLDNCSGILMK